MNGYPRGFLTWLWITLAILLLSGAILVPGALELRCDWEVPWRLPGGTRLGTAAIHAAAAFGFTAFFGALAVVHMRSGLRRKKHRVSGLSLATLMLALVATGWGIYYVGERSAAVMSSAHMILGAGGVIAVAAHVLAGRARDA